MTLEEALAKIADQEKALGDLQGKLTTAEGRIANAEALIGRQSTEVGALRKENETLKGSADRIKVLEAELEEAKKLKGGGTTDGGTQDEPDVDKLEADITEDQQKVLDAAYDRATPEQRIKINSDKKVRAAFLKQAIKIAAPVPETWRKPQRKADDGKGKDDDIAALFDTHRRRTTQPPSVRSSGVREATGRTEGASKPTLNPNDVSGSLRRARESQKQKE